MVSPSISLHLLFQRDFIVMRDFASSIAEIRTWRAGSWHYAKRRPTGCDASRRGGLHGSRAGKDHGRDSEANWNSGGGGGAGVNADLVEAFG